MIPADPVSRSSSAHQARFVGELQDFVRFASVSAQPLHAGDVKRCADWLTAHLRGIGLENVAVVPTARHPIVYGDWRQARGRPPVLIYGHCDEQPADPHSERRSPPFEPAVRGEDLFDRGASNDKSQLFAHVKAVESCLRAAGRLPLNVICLFAGEEEIGSPNRPSFLAAARDRLVADVAVISDTLMLGADRPAITYGAARRSQCGNSMCAVRRPICIPGISEALSDALVDLAELPP